MRKARRRSSDSMPVRRPRLPAVDEGAPRHVASPTAIAVEAIRTGVMPRVVGRRADREEIPHESEICMGDPDDGTLRNEYVGEDTPGGSTPTPDQNGVDDIGRAYGLQEEDTGTLQSAGDVLTRRARHRTELRPPRTPR